MERQRIERRPKATGKVLRLFDEDVEIKDYRYGCFVTSLDLSAHLASFSLKTLMAILGLFYLK